MHACVSAGPQPRENSVRRATTRSFRLLLCGFAAAIAMAAPVSAQDRLQDRSQEQLKLALGQRGNWDTAIPELGQQAGIFKKHGLSLDILWTQGAGESQQAVLASSVDIA